MSTAMGLVMAVAGLSPAMAQQQPTPPEHYTLDPRGVDLVSGTFNYSTTDVTIGQPGQGGLSFGRVWANGGWRDTLSGTIKVSGSTYIVSLGGSSEAFTLSGGVFTPVSNTGATLTQSGGLFTYTMSDGTVAAYVTTYSGNLSPYDANDAALSTITAPNGEVTTLYWNGITYCTGYSQVDENNQPAGDCIGYRNAVRLEAVRNNRGYQINFIYAASSIPDDDISARFEWLRRTEVVGVNLAVDACLPHDQACATTRTWPKAVYNAGEYGGTVTTITDQAGRTTTYSYDGGGRLNGVLLPGASTNAVNLTYDGTGKVAQVTDASGTWNYSYSDSGSTRTTSTSGPLGQSLSVASDLTIGRATSVTNGVGQTVGYQYDNQSRLQRITNPEGDYVQIGYDFRGNVTVISQIAKTGSDLSTVSSSTAYAATCTNPVICNKPISTTDARGNVTDYTWNATHGGLESVTLPVPGSWTTVRPQTRIAYAPHTAYYRTGSGGVSAAPSPVYLPISTSACAAGTAPACVGTTDEVKSTITYGASGVANNLLPTVTTSGDGAGVLTAATAMTYDPNGDLATVDGPLPGSADTTRYLYDVARRPVGAIGPDPDAGGSLQNRAQRITYDGRGLASLVEAGMTAGYTDANWVAFTPLQRQATEYDAAGRPVVSRAQDASGATLSLSQVSYDAAGRLECAATRMNPHAFGSLPASACTVGSGPFGPDRVTRAVYDAAGRTIQTISGHNSGSPITESVSYTANGKPYELTDGAGNVSRFTYDGFDRLVVLNYPHPTDGGINTDDYEQYAYDADSNVVGRRDRAGQWFGTYYDAIGRMGSVYSTDAPPTMAQRHYNYDNLGRLVNVNTPDGSPFLVAWGYDGLGRQTSEQVWNTSTAATSTVSYAYDLAGRRTRMTWPDGYYATYDWNDGGDLIAIKENGVTTLAAYGYDTLGRRTATQRGNGVWSSYGYDGIGRLAWMNNDPTGTAQDVTWTYAYNPAGQIASRSVNNSAYVYTPAAGSTTYANNGRNQVATINGAATTHDDNQNLTSAAGSAYGFDALNRLTGAAPLGASATSLGYDTLDRLWTAQSGATRFLYDGQQAIAEYDASGNLTQRHVPGLGLDEVVVSYDAGGNRTWLLADERGSVVGLAHDSGAATINRYDEYGVPGPGNLGRFQYTGQAWLPDAQLYHYRARAYAPTLGRFLQTDPIGYAAGANIYTYVGGDPVNLSDSLGLSGRHISEGRCLTRGGIPTPNPNKGEGEGKDDHDFCVTGLPIGRGSGPSVGNTGGGGSGYPSEAQQEQECNTATFQRWIGNPTWEAQTRSAMGRALSTPSIDYRSDASRNASEVGFFAGMFGPIETVGSSFTQRRRFGLTPGYGIELGRWLFASERLLWHSHQSDHRSTASYSTNSLSRADVNWSRRTGIPIMAQRSSGERYCYAP